MSYLIIHRYNRGQGACGNITEWTIKDKQIEVSQDNSSILHNRTTQHVSGTKHLLCLHVFVVRMAVFMSILCLMSLGLIRHTKNK